MSNLNFFCNNIFSLITFYTSFSNSFLFSFALLHFSGFLPIFYILQVSILLFSSLSTPHFLPSFRYNTYTFTLFPLLLIPLLFLLLLHKFLNHSHPLSCHASQTL